jgi:hypothetical protein
MYSTCELSFLMHLPSLTCGACRIAATLLTVCIKQPCPHVSIRTFVVPRRRCNCFLLYLPFVYPPRSPSLITLLDRRIQTKPPSLLRLTAVNFPCHLFHRSLILSLNLSGLPFPFLNIPRLLTRHESLNTPTELPTRRYNPKVQSFIPFFGQSA